MKIDILIRGGHVVDPARGVDGILDVGIDRGIVADVSGQAPEAIQVIDASGCYVFPGLIDFHAHLYHTAGKLGSRPDFMCSTGVTSVVDAGSSGCDNFEDFREKVIAKSVENIKAQISCYSSGMANGHENFDPALFEADKIAAVRARYPGEIIGLKIRVSRGLVEDIEPLKAAVRMSEKIGNAPVCVHVTNTPCDMGEIAETLRKGDIFCHTYQGTGGSILDGNGKILKKVLQARERGVIFDAAPGKMNCSHRVTLACLAQGFTPDVISTDMTGDKMHYSSRSRSLPFVMSRFLSMGMELREVVRCVTETPAKLTGEEGKRGTLAPGAIGGAVVMTVASQTVNSYDTDGTCYAGNRLFVPQLTVLNGEIAYCHPTFNLPQNDFGI